MVAEYLTQNTQLFFFYPTASNFQIQIQKQDHHIIPFLSPSRYRQILHPPLNLALPLSLSKLPPGGKGRFNLLAMATVRVLSFTFLFGVLLVQQCICTDAPASSPTPAPESGADVPSPSVTPAPSPSSNLTSPPAPPLSDFPPAPSPVNATSKESPSPAPTPAPNSDVASDISHASTEESKESAGGGMTSGKKAGIAVGVIAAVCFVGLGALVYKKRQQNIQRSQFGYDARREIL
ncbi:hypothetical protein T459_16742 [Capsicum annuum]|uniref:Uncharacterized protein n=2 Tax=Capsicum annuum TaxID=4072 RepID=A0A2G2Z9M2_CAPAN|nr:hypothetical protein T459_16742 [Capsicum annuum]